MKEKPAVGPVRIPVRLVERWVYRRIGDSLGDAAGELPVALHVRQGHGKVGIVGIVGVGPDPLIEIGLQEGQRNRSAQGFHRQVRFRPAVIAVFIVLVGHVAPEPRRIHGPVEAVQIIIPGPAAPGLVYAGEVHVPNGGVQPQAGVQVGDRLIGDIVNGVFKNHEGVGEGEVPGKAPLDDFDAELGMIGDIFPLHKDIGIAGKVILVGDGLRRIETGHGVLGGGRDGRPDIQRFQGPELETLGPALKHAVHDGRGHPGLAPHRAAHPQAGVGEVLHLLAGDLGVLLVLGRWLDLVFHQLVAVAQHPEVGNGHAQLINRGKLVKIVGHLHLSLER